MRTSIHAGTWRLVCLLAMASCASEGRPGTMRASRADHRGRVVLASHKILAGVLLWRDENARVQVTSDEAASLSDAERAAVGWVAASLGSDCDWAEPPALAGDGTGMANAGRMLCKLTSALGFDDQCGDKHRSFMKQWLGSDIPRYCYKRPMTSFEQTVLDEVKLSHEGSSITVRYEATGVSSGVSWGWSETLSFVEAKGSIRLAGRQITKRRGEPPRGFESYP